MSTFAPMRASHSAVSSTAACSVASVTMRRRSGGKRVSAPFSAQLSASVAPEVK
jgi:hypothetical protein